jgi:hypothetical protein
MQMADTRRPSAVNYFEATNFTSIEKSSLIILSPRFSKNDFELYLMSYLERSTTSVPVASAPVAVVLTVTGNVAGLVIPLIVRSPVTS